MNGHKSFSYGTPSLSASVCPTGSRTTPRIAIPKPTLFPSTPIEFGTLPGVTYLPTTKTSTQALESKLSAESETPTVVSLVLGNALRFEGSAKS